MECVPGAIDHNNYVYATTWFCCFHPSHWIRCRRSVSAGAMFEYRRYHTRLRYPPESKPESAVAIIQPVFADVIRTQYMCNRRSYGKYTCARSLFCGILQLFQRHLLLYCRRYFDGNDTSGDMSCRQEIALKNTHTDSRNEIYMYICWSAVIVRR